MASEGSRIRTHDANKEKSTKTTRRLAVRLGTDWAGNAQGLSPARTAVAAIARGDIAIRTQNALIDPQFRCHTGHYTSPGRRVCKHRKSPLRDGRHSTADRAALLPTTEVGETDHEYVPRCCRVDDPFGFYFTGIRTAGLPERHLATWSLWLHQLG